MKDALTNVNEQYKTAENLKKRISIHDKYSTNKTGFGNWIFSHYSFHAGMNILELGAGNGDMWINRTEDLPKGAKLLLTDFSDGMVKACKANVGTFDNIQYEVVNAENIPYLDESFDAVIANMMLYHVPDIDRAISEIARVLKKDGVFYCATYGENGIMPFVTDLLKGYGVKEWKNERFTLQNAEAMLHKCFASVIRCDYDDSLAVTDANDLCDYVYSLPNMTDLTEIIERKDMVSTFEANMTDGVLIVPKEYGMFICRKSDICLTA